MAKSSIKKIEEDKKKIIYELEKDSRQSSHEIAEKLGFSRQKVWNIIKSLENEKIIWGYSTVINENFNNNETYFALLKQDIPYLKSANLIIENLKSGNTSKLNIKLIDVYYTNGPYDAIIIFCAQSIKDAKKYLGYLMKEYGEVIESIDLVQSVFPLWRFGKINPNINEFKDYSVG